MKKMICCACVMTLVSFTLFEADLQASVNKLVFVPPRPTPEELQSWLEHTQREQQEKEQQLQKELLEVQQKLQQVLQEQSASGILPLQQTPSQSSRIFVPLRSLQQHKRILQDRLEQIQLELLKVQQKLQQVQQKQSPQIFVPPTQEKLLQQTQQPITSLPKPIPVESQAQLKHTQHGQQQRQLEMQQKLQQAQQERSLQIFVPPTREKLPQIPSVLATQPGDSEQQQPMIASGSADAPPQATAEAEWCMPQFDMNKYGKNAQPSGSGYKYDDMPVYYRGFFSNKVENKDWLDPKDEIKRKALMEPTDEIKRKALMEPTDANIDNLIKVIDHPEEKAFQNFIDSRWRALVILADDGIEEARKRVYGEKASQPEMCKSLDDYNRDKEKIEKENQEMDNGLDAYLRDIQERNKKNGLVDPRCMLFQKPSEIEKYTSPVVDAEGLLISAEEKLHASFPIAYEFLGKNGGGYGWLISTPSSCIRGWKLHISARPSSALKIAQIVAPICDKKKVGYKAFLAPAMRKIYVTNRFNKDVYKDVSDLGRSAEFKWDNNFSQVGKFIAIYPKTDEQAYEIAKEIHDAFNAAFEKEKPEEKLSREDFVSGFGEFQIGETGGITARLCHYEDEEGGEIRECPYISTIALKRHAKISWKENNEYTYTPPVPPATPTRKYMFLGMACFECGNKDIAEKEKSKIEQLLKNIEKNKERVKELEGKGKLSPMESGELTTLKEQTDKEQLEKELKKWTDAVEEFTKKEQKKQKLNKLNDDVSNLYAEWINKPIDESVDQQKHDAMVDKLKIWNDQRVKELEIFNRLVWKEFLPFCKLVDNWVEIVLKNATILEDFDKWHETVQKEVAELKTLKCWSELNDWCKNWKEQQDQREERLKALEESCTKSYLSPFRELGLYLNGRRVDRRDGGSGEPDRPVLEIMNKELKYNYNFELIMKDPVTKTTGVESATSSAAS